MLRRHLLENSLLDIGIPYQTIQKIMEAHDNIYASDYSDDTPIFMEKDWDSSSIQYDDGSEDLTSI